MELSKDELDVWDKYAIAAIEAATLHSINDSSEAVATRSGNTRAADIAAHAAAIADALYAHRNERKKAASAGMWS